MFGMSVGVGRSFVGVSIASWVGVADAVAIGVAVGVRVANRATRIVGVGVGVAGSEANSPN